MGTIRGLNKGENSTKSNGEEGGSHDSAGIGTPYMWEKREVGLRQALDY